MVKVKANERDELTVKNLTVFANAFEPVAREKIEAAGGKCIRLLEEGNVPADFGAIYELNSAADSKVLGKFLADREDKGFRAYVSSAARWKAYRTEQDAAKASKKA
mmetsp:Transcript_23640/g.66892  ORF Transcript_23640/g.66892 Transcript_23640/m.66892 type:complete len:106 (-) Transcript_23640:198-515(-)